MTRIKTIIQAAKYLATCRAALPRWMQALLGVALVCTCLPGVPDFGLDEAIYVVIGMVLWFRYRPLLRVVWAAARLEVSA